MEMTMSATTCYSMIRFSDVLRTTFVSPYPNRKCAKRVLRIFSTCASPITSTVDPIIVHSSQFQVLASNLSAANVPQRSEEWFALRKDKLTTSTFSTALGFWKGGRRGELWHEKVFASEAQIMEVSKNSAMEWGTLNESVAIEQYKKITGNEVSSMGFVVHSKQSYDWLGASPDGVLRCSPQVGLLEVKCPYNKGKPEAGLPWSSMPFYYMPQVQGQMEIMDCEWVDLYCWMPNGSTIFRVLRQREYWNLIHEILREFWWENVVPAREVLLLGREEEVKSYKPASTHKKTGLAIAKSIKLASETKLLCRELAGHIEFFS
ncbi:uncharacterized protein LOC124840150 [Vigna umbellata]|uniref:YqaJ viral recombinase domain-containing protein n=2 Tax=Phaseolus angularis TaxID=3914 RepID=A0A0L9TLE3_PHAAN|nr:uncharacterized protein LOC108332677 [Vigna angularis]XP_047172111.1 uncharacterized protein LOC124840150 [Vigna umbellata]XP_047172112.1 uncharacterized protein LOC124840150 [Vigna umbellata]BAT74323.1 hypothetical protein VIGAN_01197200 [Vigna angularis var. angularis]KAG2409669.1 uncharacterized protein HKW66_Vig0003340 [Vigna angularis]KOM31375.1 hypothetical protein LR48_Vigan01g093000 [Vigna angularis]